MEKLWGKVIGGLILNDRVILGLVSCWSVISKIKNFFKFFGSKLWSGQAKCGECEVYESYLI